MSRIYFLRHFTLALAFALVTACTTVPEQLQGSYAEISPARVQTEIYGTHVRWGGVIIGTKIYQEKSCFEVLSRELGKYLRPKIQDQTAGRFLACTSGFYDPEVYAKGREVTVTGEIKSVEVRKVDEFDYRYPVLGVDTLVLWEKRKDVLVHRGGYYDPFYSPYYWGYYPYGRFPYYHRPWGMYHGGGYTYTRKTLPNPAVTVSGDPDSPESQP
jgi:outer membrane lipoprotein